MTLRGIYLNANDFIVDDNRLDQGKFGEIFPATSKSSRVQAYDLAVKKFKGQMDEKAITQIENEALIMHMMGSHPNIVHSLGLCHDKVSWKSSITTALSHA